MKNGLPYLSKDLFWMAMEDIVKHADLVSGHSWRELKEMLDNQAHEPQPQLYSVMKFGKYRGGSLQMLRNGTWYSYDKEN